MSDLRTAFEAAVDQVQNAPADGTFKPSNDFKLKMYALYRQANDGNVSGKKPGMLDPIGRMKYQAWEKVKGMPSEQAMQEYINAVTGVASEHG